MDVLAEEVRKQLEKLVFEGEGFVDILVYVKPEQQESKLVLEGGELVYYSVEPDVGGRPNADLVRFIAGLLNIPTSRVEIVYGARSGTKRVRIYEVDRETVLEALERTIRGA